MEQLDSVSCLYHSQHGQDEFIAKTLFKNKRDGFFMEIGAYDGIQLSNTYHFEKHLGWHGICIEPVKPVFEKLRQSRNCICLNICISAEEGVADFYYVTGECPKGTKYCSGLVKQYPPQHEKVIEKEIEEYGGGKSIIQTECVKLESVFKKYGIVYIDYLSIDVEGAELDILKSINFDQIYIDVLSIENLYFGKIIQNFLESVGYQYIKKIGFDEIYRKK